MQDLIERFALTPHPEGGYYRQNYCSRQQLSSPVHGQTRPALTHIYFLLTAGQVSRFHEVLHDEVWNFYAGAPLKLIEYVEGKPREILLGAPHQQYCHVIEAGVWQAAESTGDYSLVGCTVAPGFDFADFSFIEDESLKTEIQTQWPDLSRFI
ncbi:cupin domain-containing protein [Aestuariibacter salexigens]|uniref:cupin domain-containing protein n=1 Tax=Aestuariibacter salexigens TaxID=226010 RepID=UPI0003F87ACA|nr:cupin domain-containing protein [Aestuariibacter salexigens]